MADDVDIPSETGWAYDGKKLGQGGQAKVVKVRRIHGTEVGAMKILATDRPLQTALQRFEREAGVIAKLSSPHIVRLLDHGMANQKFVFYVMEYHEGARPLIEAIEADSSDRVVAKFKGNALASLAVYNALLEAMKSYTAEPHKVVHRDLSPNNVLLLTDGSVRVIDFGICHVDQGETVTMTGERMGTRDFAAPEVEGSTDDDHTWASDLYSAGKILWALYTGRPKAFPREDRAFNSLRLESLISGTDSEHLMHIIERTIRRRVEDRYATIDQAIGDCRTVQRLIRDAAPTLAELQSSHCPVCRYGRLEDSQIAKKMLSPGGVWGGNPTEDVVMRYQSCSYCGFMFARDAAIVDRRLGRFNGLS